MSKSIDLRMAQPANMKDAQFQKVLEIVETQLNRAFPSALVRVRKSTSMSELSVFGLGKQGKEEVGEFLEELFNNGYLFEDL